MFKIKMVNADGSILSSTERANVPAWISRDSERRFETRTEAEEICVRLNRVGEGSGIFYSAEFAGLGK